MSPQLNRRLISCVLCITFIFVSQVVQCSAAEQSACEKKILKGYPDAVCSSEKNKESCRAACEEKGEKKCQGSRADIKKLNCKKKDGESSDEPIVCCCDISCEAKALTKNRLNQAINETMSGSDSTGICNEGDKEEIKGKLKELCRTDKKVQVARKYCMEEKKGKYFCLKEGKCFGTTCKGCIKHECEINKKKTIITVPDDYISKNLESANRVLAKDINVEDKSDAKAVEKWCTMLKDRSKCNETCISFGDRICQGQVLDYNKDDQCKRDAKECSCCCSPTCSVSSQGNKTPSDGLDLNNSNSSKLDQSKENDSKSSNITKVSEDEATENKTNSDISESPNSSNITLSGSSNSTESDDSSKGSTKIMDTEPEESTSGKANKDETTTTISPPSKGAKVSPSLRSQKSKKKSKNKKQPEKIKVDQDEDEAQGKEKSDDGGKDVDKSSGEQEKKVGKGGLTSEDSDAEESKIKKSEKNDKKTSKTDRVTKKDKDETESSSDKEPESRSEDKEDKDNRGDELQSDYSNSQKPPKKNKKSSTDSNPSKGKSKKKTKKEGFRSLGSDLSLENGTSSEVLEKNLTAKGNETSTKNLTDEGSTVEPEETSETSQTTTTTQTTTSKSKTKDKTKGGKDKKSKKKDHRVEQSTQSSSTTTASSKSKAKSTTKSNTKAKEGKEKSNSIPDEVADEGEEESVPDIPSTSNRSKSKSKSSKSKPVSEKVIGSKKYSDEDQEMSSNEKSKSKEKSKTKNFFKKSSESSNEIKKEKKKKKKSKKSKKLSSQEKEPIGEMVQRIEKESIDDYNVPQALRVQSEPPFFLETKEYLSEFDPQY